MAAMTDTTTMEAMAIIAVVVTMMGGTIWYRYMNP